MHGLARESQSNRMLHQGLELCHEYLVEVIPARIPAPHADERLRKTDRVPAQIQRIQKYIAVNESGPDSLAVVTRLGDRGSKYHSRDASDHRPEMRERCITIIENN